MNVTLDLKTKRYSPSNSHVGKYTNFTSRTALSKAAE